MRAVLHQARSAYSHVRPLAFRVVGAGLALALVLAVAVSVVVTARRREASPKAALAVVDPGSRGPKVGVPAGYSHTSDGVAAAAANYVVVLSGPLTVSDVTRAATLSAASATDVAPAVAQRFAGWQRVERLTGLIAAVESGVPKVLSTAVLGTRVRSFTPERAVVDVWAVSAVGTSTSGRVDSMWSTETVSLGWEGDWKVRNYSSASGPVPAQQQPVTPFAQFLAAVSDMEGTGHVSPR